MNGCSLVIKNVFLNSLCGAEVNHDKTSQSNKMSDLTFWM
jgi:hypothetical protein